MNKNIKKPNFFIIGAPKCGTTALSEYLREHPDVFFSESKEIHYFNTDFSSYHRKDISEDEYLEMYFKNSSGYKAVGEGSVWYLFSNEAVPNILKFNREAKFVVMVRDPINMFYSRYMQSCLNFWENARTPQEAWNLQSDRILGKNIPKYCPDPKLLFYKKACSLGEQLERLYKQVPKELVKVVFFDDLKSDTRKVYLDVLKFLGLPDDGREEFPRINARKKLRSKNIRYLIEFLKYLKYKANIKKNFGIHTPLKKVERKFNKTKIDKVEPLPESFKKELLEYFDKDIDKLSKLTGRDLSHWKEV